MDPYFEASYAKLGTSSCKKCKEKIEKGSLRLAKVVINPYSSTGGEMRQYHHVKCIFDTFVRARPTTKIITEPDDIRGFDDLEESDQQSITETIEDLVEKRKSPSKKQQTPKKTKTSPAGGGGSSKKPAKAAPARRIIDDDDFINDDETDEEEDHIPPPPKKSFSTGAPASTPSDAKASKSTQDGSAVEKDNSFREFRKLCADIANDSSHTGKTALVAKYLDKGSTGSGFHGDVFLLLKLLLPGVIKAVYNLQDKQLVKGFSVIFDTDLDEMIEDLEQGDVAETIALFFDKSNNVKPQKKSTLSLQEVDTLLIELSDYTKEDDQVKCLTKIAKRCTANDVKMVVRLIKHDLRINAGARQILDGLGPNAYEAFQASRDLRAVVNKVKNVKDGSVKGELTRTVSVGAHLMTPIQPMLAEACRSVEQAFRRCPNGMYAEIKYDGERVQLHKKGTSFKYFSRSLKPVQQHKVQHLKEFIPQAFKNGSDLILDCEILLVDKNGRLLPFGTLGVHKRNSFKDAHVCLFVFDCLHYNGETLLDKPIKVRRRILEENMTAVKDHILFSEIKSVKNKDDLTTLMMKVFSDGLEGLVLKDTNSIYEPGKRHWLKIKKDYLADGTMADTADLVVLGAYFGTGSKGGKMSIFLMGVYDPNTFRWCTVTKCGNGLDDKMINRLQRELDVKKISRDPAQVPAWLSVTKTLIPDFIVTNPKKSQVWEITGAEFSRSNVHTAGGISIRFPRLSRIRDDKSVKQATDLPQLLKLFASSSRRSDIPELLKKKHRKLQARTGGDDDDDEIEDDDDDDGVDTEDEVLTDTNEDEIIDLNPKNNKRKSDDSADGQVSPPKKTKTENATSLPQCKYGTDCYQQNTDHRSKFSHPPAQSTSKTVPTSKPEAKKHNATDDFVPSDTQVLTNLFTGMKFYLPTNLPRRTELYRYIIAFDGDVVGEFERSRATHVVVSTDKEARADSTGKTVSVAWVTKCIKRRQLVAR